MTELAPAVRALSVRRRSPAARQRKTTMQKFIIAWRLLAGLLLAACGETRSSASSPARPAARWPARSSPTSRWPAPSPAALGAAP